MIYLLFFEIKYIFVRLCILWFCDPIWMILVSFELSHWDESNGAKNHPNWITGSRDIRCFLWSNLFPWIVYLVTLWSNLDDLGIIWIVSVRRFEWYQNRPNRITGSQDTWSMEKKLIFCAYYTFKRPSLLIKSCPNPVKKFILYNLV